MKAKWMIAFLVSASSAAIAAGPDMSTLDANGDGVISSEEALAYPELAKQFEALDENQDQQLDQAEFARFEADEGMN